MTRRDRTRWVGPHREVGVATCVVARCFELLVRHPLRVQVVAHRGGVRRTPAPCAFLFGAKPRYAASSGCAEENSVKRRRR